MDRKPKDKILVTTVGKVIFNSIIPEGMPYLNEPTDVNLTTSTDDRFFMDAGQDIKEVLAGIDTVRPFKKDILEISSLKSSNVTVQQLHLSTLTA